MFKYTFKDMLFSYQDKQNYRSQTKYELNSK